jgi:putative CocE/NonD family hydrolase
MRSLKVLAALLLLMAIPAWSQQLTVPDTAVSDLPALERAIPDLARQALAQLPADPLLRLEYQFRFQLAAGQYEEALATFDEWSKVRPAPASAPAPDQTVEPFLRPELNARARALEAREKIPYGEALKKAVDQKFASYSDRVAADSAWNLGLPPAVARANFERQLQQLKGKRTVTPAELVETLRWHAIMQAVESFAPVLDAAIAGDDARRFVIERGVLIKAKDGATLTADVVRPKRLTGPQPAAVRYTIYTDASVSIRDAKDAAARGYVGVSAHARGKYLSPDEIRPWETEVQDTWAVIDWISKQPWSDGKVGMYGHSYDGFAAWAAAKNPHPALKTIVASGASFPGNGLPMQNNVIQTVNYGWPLQVTSNKYMGAPELHDNARWSKLLTNWFESGRPLREIDAIDGTPNKVLQRQLLHPSYDSYFQAMQPYRREFAKIDIPVLSLTGYFDDANSAAVNYVVDNYKYNRKGEHYLVVGPYQHFRVLSVTKDPVVFGYTIDPVAQIDTLHLTFQWFDHVLRGGPKPALLKDRINYQLMGTNTWRHAPSIGTMANRRQRLYLTDQKVGNRYDLSARQPAQAGFVQQTVDFADRKTQNNVYPFGAYLAKPDAPTHITYVSEPFDEPVSIDGLITGQLRVTIDRKDFDFAWALYEAMPDGRYFKLSYYLGRASYAEDPTMRKLLTPGKPASLPFSRTALVGRQLSKGSRLVLLLTVNKNAAAQVNYGTGKDVSDESVADAKQPLRIQWHNGSFIDVPLRVGGADGAADKGSLTSSRASGT